MPATRGNGLFLTQLSGVPARWRPMLALICAAALVLQSGCAVTPYQLPSPPSEEIRARFGTIGIVSARFPPQPMLQLPAQGGLAGAGRGAATWSATWGLAPFAAGGGGGGDGGGAILILAASVVGATLGGISGTVAGVITSEPTERVRVSEDALNDALAVLNIQESLRDRILSVARDRTREQVVILPDKGPAAPGEKVAYGSLAEAGIDTVVEVAVTDIGINGPWDVNPPLNFIMKASVRVVRTSADQEYYAAEYEYRRGELTFSGWAADNAEPFLVELDWAYRGIAEKVVEELFLIYLPPVAEEFSLLRPPPISGPPR